MNILNTGLLRTTPIVEPIRMVIRCKNVNISPRSEALLELCDQVEAFKVVKKKNSNEQIVHVILYGSLWSSMIHIVSGGEAWDSRFDPDDKDYDDFSDYSKMTHGTLIEIKLKVQLLAGSHKAALNAIPIFVRNMGSPLTNLMEEDEQSYKLGSKHDGIQVTLHKHPANVGLCAWSVTMDVTITRTGLKFIGIQGVEDLTLVDICGVLAELICIYDGDKDVLSGALCDCDSSPRDSRNRFAKFDKEYGKEQFLGVALSKNEKLRRHLVNRSKEIFC